MKKDKRCPGVVEYPLEAVIKSTGLAYLNNTTAYAIAFAVANEIGSLHIFGIDFSYQNTPHFAESGRACCEFWVATGISKGMKIEVAHNSPFLDTNVPSEQKTVRLSQIKRSFSCFNRKFFAFGFKKIFSSTRTYR